MIGGLYSRVVDHGTGVSDESAHGAGNVIIDGENLLDARRLDQRRRDSLLYGQHHA